MLCVRSPEFFTATVKLRPHTFSNAVTSYISRQTPRQPVCTNLLVVSSSAYRFAQTISASSKKQNPIAWPADIEKALDACEAKAEGQTTFAIENGKDYRCYMETAVNIPSRQEVLQ